MKVIDILQRIANGEEALLIKYKDKILHWNKEKVRFEDKDGINTLYEMDFSELNDEVEIIEEDKKIEKVNTYVLCDSDFERMGVHSLKATEIIDKAFEEYSHKINEIIDYINGGTNGE